ncbi:hypothetical protein H4R18_003164 [Coemansia javaensis]|uniref:Superoxide dismutase copper/zinc binding domain-containing protein n=1 Tax=Coemansia javaensis TaxID=2761396 RepID=A0A9W8H9Q1_9FUNG|nr:hypothetical protein H4R18_003164 [Coemansia javaensis]
MRLVSLLPALAAAAVVVAGQGLTPTDNPRYVTVAIARPSGNGIRGAVRFTRLADGSGLQLDVQAEGLEGGVQYPYHIHVNPVPASGDCMATGGHLDPDRAKALAGGAYRCDPAQTWTCEAGDLAGIYGNLTADGSGSSKFKTSYRSTVLSFDGRVSVLGHSIVIHAPNNTRLACANIVGYKKADHKM